MLSSVSRSISYTLQQNNINRSNHTETPAVNFKDKFLQAALETASSTSEPELSNATANISFYLSELQMKFGSKISVQDMEYSKANINHIGSSTSGTGNVIIAPNILEKMASDPKARQYYEKKIQAHFDTNGEANAFMAMHGRQITSRGVIIHPNGEVTYYCSSDYTPEEKARLEKAMKEEDEAKAKKRAEEQRLNEIALNKRLSLTPNTISTIQLLSSNMPEHYTFQTPSNIDTSIFQTLIYRLTKLR